jgi:hypothetical protein
MTCFTCGPRSCNHDGCKNFARKGKDTCRWHDPGVLALREEAEATRRAALRAAGAA